MIWDWSYGFSLTGQFLAFLWVQGNLVNLLKGTVYAFRVLR